MAKNNHNVNAFVAGEVSPKFFGRTTSQAYNDSCEELTNMWVYPQGGMGRRTGTKFVRRILDRNGLDVTEAMIIPFVGSDNSRWQIVITPEDPLDNPGGGDKLDPTIARNIFAVNTATEQIFYCYGNDVYYESAIYDGYYYASGTNILKAQYAQAIDTVYVSFDGSAPLVITYAALNDGVTATEFKFQCSPYLEALALGTPNNWRRMPFQSPVFTAASGLRVTNTAGVLKLEDESLAAIFTADYIGRYYKFTNTGTHAGSYVVTDFISATELRLEFLGGTNIGIGTNNVYGKSITDYYEVGFWDRISGFPRCVNIYDNRLVWGGNDQFPDYEWYSAVGNYDRLDVRKLESDSDFATPQATTSPFEAVFRGGRRGGKICWIEAAKTLVTGTSSGEHVSLAPSSESEIGFDNYRRTLETPHGSAYAQAQRVENTTVFIQRDRKTLRELVYNFNEDSFQAFDLNILSPDITKRGFVARVSDYLPSEPDNGFQAISMQQIPYQIMWAIDASGCLYGVTRERRQEVLAWHFHKIAGEYTLKGGIDDGELLIPYVRAIATNQFPDVYGLDVTGEPDELWMTVTRAFQEDEADDCVPVTYLERMYLPWENKNIFEQWLTSTNYKRVPIYMDCTYVTDSDTEAVATGVILNLPHSHGQVVTVVCNGQYFGEYTVNAGSIDISDKLNGSTTWQALIGLNFVARAVPMCQEKPAQIGTSQGLPRRDHEIVINFHDTIGARFGLLNDEDTTPINELEDVTFPDPENQDDPPKMFTGMRRLKMPLGYDERPRIVIESHLPYPMNVSHIVTKGVVYE